MVLSVSGLVAGVLAGFLGIGGGAILVPLMVALGYVPVQAVATSSLAILMTSLSGSLQNWRMGFFDTKKILALGIPAIPLSILGAYLADRLVPYMLLFVFGISMLVNIYLVDLRQRLAARHAANTKPIAQPEPVLATLIEQPETVPAIPSSQEPERSFSPAVARAFTGGAAGLLAGLFGMGGGVIMVPLQILLLGENIKVAAQTSLGVIVISAISACVNHAYHGNILFAQGLLLGFGGLVGAQFGTRFLPKMSDELVSLTFKSVLGILALYVFWKAWFEFTLQ
nr:sulfite exporter TauE/SafE family protein [Anthocerotibacter panamensis]